MSYPAHVEISEAREKKLAVTELVNETFSTVWNIPIACEIIDLLVEELKNDGDIEDFVARLQYVLASIPVYTHRLHKCLKAAGYHQPPEY